MNYREQVAHHEAAHAIMGISLGPGISGGIDLDATTSVAGATGNIMASLFVPDATLPEEEQRRDLMRNLMIFCAGAASDARITGRSLADALKMQPGDQSAAREHAKLHPILSEEIDE